jgi:hypothetical protein
MQKVAMTSQLAVRATPELRAVTAIDNEFADFSKGRSNKFRSSLCVISQNLESSAEV